MSPSPTGIESNDSDTFYPGLLLDRYELLCPLAQGGMGAVWLARYTGKFGFTRLVVVKVMLAQYARDENMRAMFIDEARIAASIDHPNVVSTLDVGEQDGILFLAMNWVDGDSLSRLVLEVSKANQRLPAGVALKIAADVCAGLHAAHELRDQHDELRGLVHRDVSPQNILLATNGRAMLIDFGIAKANKRVSEETSVGRIKGKLSYMSPEQARTSAVDRRADIFSVGAVLYEIFAGVPPFERESDIQTLTRLTRGGPASPLPVGTHPVVQNVVMRALALEPSARYQTAEEMSYELVVAMREIGAPTTDQEVARYGEPFLAGRRDQRQQAVQNALFAADDTMAVAREEMRTRVGRNNAHEGSRAERKPTLEFDASPFASALGPYGMPRQRGAYGPPTPSDPFSNGANGANGANGLAPNGAMGPQSVHPSVIPGMLMSSGPSPSSADLSANRSASYPVLGTGPHAVQSLAAGVNAANGTGQLPAQRGGDPIHEIRELWKSVKRSAFGQAFALQMQRWNLSPTAVTMISVSAVVLFVVALIVIKAAHASGNSPADLANQPLPTMTLPATAAPPRQGTTIPGVPLVQQGQVTTTPTWSPTPSPPAPGTATATSTSFPIPAPTSVRRRNRGKPVDPDPNQ